MDEKITLPKEVHQINMEFFNGSLTLRQEELLTGWVREREKGEGVHGKFLESMRYMLKSDVRQLEKVRDRYGIFCKLLTKCGELIESIVENFDQSSVDLAAATVANYAYFVSQSNKEEKHGNTNASRPGDRT